MPSRSADPFAGGAATLRPRPGGRSGRVSSAATSCRAASRSSTSAPNGAVAATAIRTLSDAVTGCGRSVASASLARLVVGPLEDQHAVEVVELVLDDARLHALELEPERRSRDVLALDRDLAARARPARARPGARGSPPRRSPSRRERFDDLGVDDRRRLLVVGEWKTKTRRSTPTCVAASPTPCASCIRSHPLGEPRELVVELSTSRARMRRTGVRVLADLRERERGAAPRPRRRAARPRSTSSSPPSGAGSESPGCSACAVECSQSDCGSTSTTAVTPARRIAGAAAASSAAGRGRERARAARSSRRAARGGGRAGAAAAPGPSSSAPLVSSPSSSRSSRSGAAASGPDATIETRWRNGG